MFVTLGEVCAINGLPTTGCDVVNNLEDAELTWIPTLNATSYFYNHWYDDVSIA